METTREIENQKQREKSTAYRLMADMWAFRDFMESILRVKDHAIKDLYQMTDFQATEARFGEIRGTLKAIEKIERELEYILNWREDEKA